MITAASAWPVPDHPRPGRQPLVHREQGEPDRAAQPDHRGDRPNSRPDEQQPTGRDHARPTEVLWFAESNTDQIGRIDPNTGAITEYGQTPGPDDDPAQNSAPTGIALGSDGNLWFTEIGSSSNPTGGIGMITPLGVRHPVHRGAHAGPDPGSGPAGITSGPDGALYFTESTTGRIGRITTLGAASEFTQGYAPTDGPASITQGPDGNLWFTELGNPSALSFGSHVDKITTTGVLTQYPSADALPSNAAPDGITTGLDGSLFFTEPGANSIGRFDTDGFLTQLDNSTIPTRQRVDSDHDPADRRHSLLHRRDLQRREHLLHRHHVGRHRGPGDVPHEPDSRWHHRDARRVDLVHRDGNESEWAEWPHSAAQFRRPDLAQRSGDRNRDHGPQPPPLGRDRRDRLDHGRSGRCPLFHPQSRHRDSSSIPDGPIIGRLDPAQTNAVTFLNVSPALPAASTAEDIISGFDGALYLRLLR